MLIHDLIKPRKFNSVSTVSREISSALPWNLPNSPRNLSNFPAENCGPYCCCSKVNLDERRSLLSLSEKETLIEKRQLPNFGPRLIAVCFVRVTGLLLLQLLLPSCFLVRKPKDTEKKRDSSWTVVTRLFIDTKSKILHHNSSKVYSRQSMIFYIKKCCLLQDIQF